MNNIFENFFCTKFRPLEPLRIGAVEPPLTMRGYMPVKEG